MRQVPLKAQKCLDRKLFAKSDWAEKFTYLIDSDSFSPVQTCLFPTPATLILLAPHPNHNVASFPIWTLISFTFENNFMTFWCARQDLEGEFLIMLHYFIALAVRASSFDDFAAPLALITCDLALSKHSGKNLLLDNFDASAITSATSMDIAVRCSSRSSAMIAKHMFS